MKIQTTVLVFMFLATFINAQIPGGNFETWQTAIFEYPQYADWTIYHETTSPDDVGLLEKSSDASDGNYAIKFNTYGTSDFGYVLYGQIGDFGPSGGFPFADSPTEVTISYKCNMAAGDSAQIWVWLYSGGIQITNDTFRVEGIQSVYKDTTFILSNYALTPDSLMFAVAPCDPSVGEDRTDGNEVYFDNVRFNGTNNVQIPDNSFEIWATIVQDYTAEMHNIEALCEKSDDAYYGNFALKMSTHKVEWDDIENEIDMGNELFLWGKEEYVQGQKRITGGLPVHARKDTLVFYYKYIPPAGVTDTAELNLCFEKDSIDVNNYRNILLPTDIYTKFEVPYDLDNPYVDVDSMVLELTSSKWRNNWLESDTVIEGSSLYIDYMYFKSQLFHTDSLALVALYNSTDGANWANSSNWLLGNVTDWYGVTVSSDRVTQVDLGSNNLVGTIPPEIGNLTNLQELSIYGNQLSSFIPSEICNLTNLNSINLSNNQLSGSIPTEIGNLTNLTTLGLTINQLSGSIPSEICNLINLTTLELSANLLSGSIPSEIGNLTNLTFLSLSGNQLSGSIPNEIGNLTNLTGLYLQSNQLSGSIPNEIGNLINLHYLYLDNNQLSGSIPAEIGNLTNLINLSLYTNQLSGAIPPQIGSLINLNVLYLFSNQLSGPVPSEITNMTSLQILSINENQLTGLPDLSPITTLSEFNASINQLTFRDIEPNIGVATNFFYYSPQDSVGEIIDTTVYIGTSYTMSVSTGGTSSQYQWKKDGTNIGSISIDSTYTLNPVAFSDSGTYTCEITNTLATDLTLNSRPINVFVDYTPFQNDSLALVALYNSTDGNNWTNNSNWLSGNVTDWYGVTVSGDRVTQIDLVDNNLVGTIPPEIGNLSNLNILFLGNNQLSGSIPPEIGNLTSLTHFHLYLNQLSGSIPPEIGDLSNLSILYFGGNQLSGSIPSEISNLTNLLHLAIENNQFSGSFPPAVLNLSNLEILNLGWNQYTGSIPPEIGNLTNLTELELYDNQFSGSIPTEIWSLPLIELRLQDNQLSGSIPTEIGNLTSLVVLQLFNNQLSGSIPPEIGSLTNLTELILSDNQLTGSIPTEIGNLTNLISLWLSSNQLSGSIPNEIGYLTNLTGLGLNNNQLTGAIPTEIGNLTNLTSLYLFSNQLSGLIPPEIGNLTNLTLLYLFSNQLSGAIPTAIGNLINLTDLWLHQNQLSGAIPSEIGNLINLNILFLANNQLSGSIPPEIGNLINLTRLGIEINQFSGPFPPEICNLINLEELNLGSIQLTGTIPKEIGNLTNLIRLHLNSNQLSDSVPAEIGSLTNLIYINLDDNQFTYLPDLSTLTSLEDLQIQNNKFTFKDIEPNISVPDSTFIYSPQDSVGIEKTDSVAINSSYTMSIEVGGDNNVYQWYLDGNLISGATDSLYTIDAVSLGDFGEYICEITNTLATDLTLYSRPINLSPKFITDAGIVDLLIPDPGCGLTNSESITVLITNFGINEISNFDVSYQINDGTVITETVTNTIPPGDTLTYTFSTNADLYTTEFYKRYSFSANTGLTGDEEPNNDQYDEVIGVYGNHTDREGWTSYSICDGIAGHGQTTGVVEDGSGNIWVGTISGVSVYNGVSWITYDTANSPLTSNAIETLYADDLGNVWIGTWEDEGGVCKYDGSTWTIYTTENSGIAGNIVEEIIEDSNGNYWFSTYNGISKYDGTSIWTTYNTGNSGLVSDWTNAITEDSNGNIWIGTGAGVSKFDVAAGTWTTYNTDNSGLERNGVYAVREDNQGNIWFGTNYGGITKLNGTTWTTYTTSNSDFPITRVFSIMTDSNGNVWFGTFGKGAVKYDGTEWIIYNEENGLVTRNNNYGYIYFWGDIFEDSNGNIWFPTYNGLAKKEPVSIEIYNIEYSHSTCNGTDDGTITICALAENPPLQYSVDGGTTYQSDSTFTGLAPGTYPIAVTDGINTVSTDTVTILDFDNISTFPFTEDFDSYPDYSFEFDNGWYNDPNNNLDWQVKYGNTPSTNTGPDNDQSGIGNYLYLEATNNFSTQSSLISPCIEISTLSNPKLKFYYHMYGSNMGELSLDIYSGGAWINNVVYISGDQGNQWFQDSVNLATYGSIIKLRFRGVTGNEYLSDIAIDEIEITGQSNENDILSFSFAEQTGAATIDNGNHTVGIEVALGTDVTALTATFTISALANITISTISQVSGVTSNNFTSPVTYTVTAEDGTTQDWVVTVTVATSLSSEKDILSFSFAEQTGVATIDAVNYTVDVEVALGTDVSALVATFTISNLANINISTTSQVSGVTANDFASPVTYTVTAEDGTTQDWVVTVSVESVQSSENDIQTYSFTEQTGPATINTVNHTISIAVANGTDLTNLVATFTISDLATIDISGTSQVSGVTANNFSNPVTYTVTAEDDTQQDWVVTVTTFTPVIISSFPYQENFETGNGNWYAGGTNSSWEHGIPSAGQTINSAASGTNAWVTNLTGDYNPDEVSYVTSPQFDLSSLNFPKIEFSIWWHVEGFYDGANLQYKLGSDAWKTLGKEESDDSWYNSSYLYSIENGFGFDLNNSAGWSGDDEWGYGSNGWVTVDHALTGFDYQSANVTFRIGFASNSGYENDGVAIDNINILTDPTGIDAVNGLLSDIQIYPNPNEGKFRLVYNGERDVDLKLQLINLQGQVIMSDQIKTGYRFSKEFELDYLSPGIYYFRLMHKEGVIVKKMVVR